MPIADRTYSFKAPAALGERLRNAGRVLEQAGSDEELARELTQRLAVDLRDALVGPTGGRRANQSALIRGALEVLVRTVEKVAEDHAYAAEYAALAHDRDPERAAFVQAAVAAAAARWRDDA